MTQEQDLTFYTNRCRHQAVFGSPQCCNAGVRYADLVPEMVGRALRLPCFISKRSYDVVPCDKLSRYTREEALAEVAEEERVVACYVVGKSPCCDAVLTELRGPSTLVKTCSKCGEFVGRECGLQGKVEDEETTSSKTTDR